MESKYSKEELYKLFKDAHYIAIWRMFKIGMNFVDVCFACGLTDNQIKIGWEGTYSPMFTLIDEICQKDFEGTRIFIEEGKII